MSDVLTRPERATDRAIAKRLRAKVTAAGGCRYCLHRLTNWGGCQASRTFPMCVKERDGAQFEPDRQKLQGDTDGKDE